MVAKRPVINTHPRSRCCGAEGCCHSGGPHHRVEGWSGAAPLLIWLPGRQQIMTRVLGTCHPHGSPRRSSRTSTGCCKHLEHKPAERRLPLFPLSPSPFLKYIKISIRKIHSFCALRRLPDCVSLASLSEPRFLHMRNGRTGDPCVGRGTVTSQLPPRAAGLA